MTWRRVAPAARRRPTSRARSATVIDSVLKMRNAPPNRASAAISAVVAWKSIVEARIEAARSSGPDRTYGSPVSASSSSTETAAAVVSSPSERSTRETAPVANSRPASAKAEDHGPPVGRGERSVAGQDPDDRLGPRAVGPAQGDRTAERQAVVVRHPLGDEGTGRIRRRRGPVPRPGRGRGAPGTSPGRSRGR